MTERNRVTPTGDIEAFALRGAWTGNRGILHRGHDIVRFHAGDLWITCALRFRGRHQEQWAPHHYTFLFFHDEAVALAAGHRPCAECRRGAYDAYRRAWSADTGEEPPTARQLDRGLHAERIVRGTHRRRLHLLPWSELPDGAFVLRDSSPALVLGPRLVPWTRGGYLAAVPRPARGEARVLTPPTSLAALRGGYAVQIDGGARGAR